jgi:hypothetical protein
MQPFLDCSPDCSSADSVDLGDLSTVVGGNIPSAGDPAAGGSNPKAIYDPLTELIWKYIRVGPGTGR